MVTTSASAEGTTIAPLDRAWQISTPLTPVGFYPKFGPLPAVIEVRDQTGAWDAPGQTRQLMLSDRGSVIEHLQLVDAPRRFEYRLSDFQKLFGKLVSGARAEWLYTEVAGGTSIRWTYTFEPYPRARLLVGLIVRLFWAPYMRRVLPGIIAEVERRV
ncbi:SRPBCC family protein [Lacisediminihabitans changchengi]|uniref:SRPBCC family protein n=1 Tax=Lacisediminihabitans changchengi TaxID=2787634 RepID=A0A934W324_9MICO|nr:SRPBCC family protein [Lacisediminihabitans changchengi]MBK4346110.1 SRPBCC family protein [Lacisediminihabitans changchengi]